MKLNPSQKRFLTSALLGYEKTLRNALQTLDSHNEQGILYKPHFTINENSRNEAKKIIQNELIQIANMVKKYDLETREVDLSNSLAAHLSENWGDLVDCSSAHLGNYGEVDRTRIEDYDREMEELADTALKLAILFGNVDD